MGTRRGGEWGPGYQVVGSRKFGDVDVPGGRVRVETVISVREEAEGEGEEVGVGKDGRRGSVVWTVVKRGSVVSVDGDGEGMEQVHEGSEKGAETIAGKIEPMETVTEVKI